MTFHIALGPSVCPSAEIRKETHALIKTNQKKKKFLSFPAEQKCAVNTLALENAVVNVEPSLSVYLVALSCFDFFFPYQYSA